MLSEIETESYLMMFIKTYSLKEVSSSSSRAGPNLFLFLLHFQSEVTEGEIIRGRELFDMLYQNGKSNLIIIYQVPTYPLIYM